MLSNPFQDFFGFKKSYFYLITSVFCIILSIEGTIYCEDEKNRFNSIRETLDQKEKQI
jgi:hypothetical protein